MPENRNPWVEQLLSWHGHDKGGVRVPFSDQGGNPLRDDTGARILVRTRLIERLEDLAGKLARGEPAPRWVFLVGGPGNGKSEAVQSFLAALDRELACSGSLVDALTRRFRPDPLVPWCVDLQGDDLERDAALFRRTVGRLVVIQDASASDEPHANAARGLVELVADLATHPAPLPVFVCCINRGLLARALAIAHREWPQDQVINVIQGVMRATALGKDALSEDRPSCWPLEVQDTDLEGRLACWPLDVESLLLAPSEGGLALSPVEQAVDTAVLEAKWEVEGRCSGCSSAPVCPFRQNAEWLRNSSFKRSLLQLLRRGELSAGQRWNFRDTFSLTAEVVVGEWQDFGDASHPCDWVHHQAARCGGPGATPRDVASAASALVARLYPNALFASPATAEFPTEVRRTAQQRGLAKSLAVEGVLRARPSGARTHIRALLAETFAPRLDPAAFSPHAEDNPLAALEDAYSQSVAMGNSRWPPAAPMAEAERILSALAADAEEEWDRLGRESAQVDAASRLLRRFIAALAKRSVGTRLGFHANGEYLAAYEAAIRNEDALTDLTEALRGLLGQANFRFNALESFGQPQSDRDWVVSLDGGSVPIDPINPAPSATDELPAHDLPFIRVASYSVPLTFDLYVALRLRQDGCASSSLPASVRAAVDRIRHLHAGSLCRDDDRFVQQGTRFVVSGHGSTVHGSIVLTRRGSTPRFREGS